MSVYWGTGNYANRLQNLSVPFGFAGPNLNPMTVAYRFKLTQSGAFPTQNVVALRAASNNAAFASGPTVNDGTQDITVGTKWGSSGFSNRSATGSTPANSADVWISYMVRYDGTNTMRTIKVHGGTAYHSSAATSWTYDMSQLDEIVIGYNYSTYGPLENIKVADVGIWTSSLSDSDRDAYFNDTPAKNIATGTLVAAYDFTTSKTADSSGNGYNLTEAGTVGLDTTDNPPSLSGAAPVISDAGDEVFNTGESITISGSGFGAAQGTGSVKLSPSDNVADAGAVSQTVTAWSDTSITFTVVKGSLDFLTGLYLFVTNDDAASNDTGYSVQLEPKVYVRETLVDLQANPVANASGLTALIWRADPASQSNPNETLTSKTTDGSGVTAWQITRGSLAVNDPIWLAIVKPGTPYKATLRKITPSYE